MKNMRFCLALLSMLPFVGWCENAPRPWMKEGVRFYENESYDRAAAAFSEAAQAAQRQKLDAAVAKYNEANALFKMRNFGAAATNYLDALRSPNLPLQSKAYYNRGNALAIGAENDEKGGRFDSAVQSLEEAIEMYENAMALAPTDKDAKINYELALKKKQELQQKQQEPQQQQKQDQENKDQRQKDQSQQQKDREKDQQQKEDQRQDQQQPQKQDQQQNKGQTGSQQQTADQQQPPRKSEEMTPEEAKMMLDAMKQEEQASRDRMRLVIGPSMPVDKDW